MNAENDEILDLVDADDKVIGTIKRGDYRRMVADNLGYVRAVDLFIVNSAGELWIPTRTADKTIAPNGLDYSVGGHVDSGETYEQAVVRETAEELNLQLTAPDLELITTVRSDNIHYFRALYIYRSDETPNFNPADFVSAEWLTPQALLTKLQSGVPAKQTISESVRLLITAGILK